MSKNFFERLREYFSKVAGVLRGEADAASVFPNAGDIGTSREQIYAEFLRQHAPSKCNVFFGGFLFGNDGNESRQIDVIITTDTAPRFDFHNPSGQGKAFSPVEGTLGIASIKSTLNKSTLEDALAGIASIPRTKSLSGRVQSGVQIKNYDDWPLKIIYASNAISVDKLNNHLNDFYKSNPNIPLSRRPNIIHVSGKYVIVRATEDLIEHDRQTKTVIKPLVGEFLIYVTEPDLQGMLYVVHKLQLLAMASTHILYSYHEFINKVLGLSPLTNAQQSLQVGGPVSEP